jgi:6-phosphogluconolactonase
MLLYVGSYSRRPGDGGIRAYECDEPTGGLVEVAHLAETSPAFLARRADGGLLFAECEDPMRSAGFVASYARRPDGRLSRVGLQATGDPCHLAVSPTGRFLIACDWAHGSIVVVPAGPSGALGPPTDVQRHDPGPGGRAPHPHCAVWDPAGERVLVADAGNDTVRVYELDETRGLLALAGAPLPLPAGTAPRHLAFHPSARWVYANGETSMSLSVLAYDPATAELTLLDQFSSISPDEQFNRDGRRYGSAEILIDGPGRYLYVCHRGPDSIAVFAVDQQRGRLRLVQRVSAGGREPRHLAFSPSGHLLYVANEHSDSVACFSVHAVTGMLAVQGTATPVPSPACLLFA